MRLINTDTLEFKEFIGTPEPYAILSHTWSEDEVSFRDFYDKPRRETQRGFEKVRFTCKQAREDGISYAWVDTCCINKESSAELSEAINSMFKWYQRAQICYAYLEDVSESGVGLSSSRWFTRGWTLQELIAPRSIDFFGAGWKRLGSKDGLVVQLAEITSIDITILAGTSKLGQASVAERMRWASNRKTTREEDMAYCLMGIFDVNMAMLYGEGPKAFIRLQEEIMKETDDQTLFAWKASPESAANYPYPCITRRRPVRAIAT
ncbi:heterokaryon incompatibility protein-domain-containing protein [Plectosphaerella cucumerina]|uniref:Heterokaryon incompatibility protein-domain-containing protein n=1 Tax=Plectosphaerella cucumerina TaxID=40658 RepID=A0A8K0TBJ4_9PEZI|nr:heterokaryon incompatibility protein-domain-containing protein [Plectosphaerella cucumerina]